jgi:hypothetical protein
LTIQVKKISQGSKSAFSKFAFVAERKNKADMFKKLSESDIDVGINAVKSREAADIGQPPGACTLISQGSVALTGGCSATFAFSGVPACPATRFEIFIFRAKRKNTRSLTLSESFRRVAKAAYTWLPQRSIVLFSGKIRAINGETGATHRFR